jgi:replicative DNA helicase
LRLADIAEHDPDRTGFVVESIGEGPFCGWTLSGGPHFMLGDFTVTHNTSFAVAIADEVMSQGKRALIVGNEDPEELYGRRLLARRSGVSAVRLRDRNMSDAEIKAAVDVVAMAKPDPLYLDAVGRYAEDVASDVASLCASEGIDLVIFDYMQKARSRKNHQDRRTELSYIRDLYGDTSKRANACSFQLTQLTGVKDGERPGRENIRDCKDLAHGAEYVLFGWTPPDSEERLLYVDKAKDGAKDVDVKLHWDSHSASFRSKPKSSYEPEFDDFGGGWER